MNETEKLDFWQARQFGNWDLGRFDQAVYESIVGAIIRISRITNSYPVEGSASSAVWFVGGLLISLDWTGGVVTISTGWQADHQRTPHEQRVYRDINRLIGEIRGVPLPFVGAVH